MLSASGEDCDRAGSPFGRLLCPERGPGPVSFLERLPSGFSACSPPCYPSPPEDAYIGQHRLLPATLQSNPVAFMTSLIYGRRGGGGGEDFLPVFCPYVQCHYDVWLEQNGKTWSYAYMAVSSVSRCSPDPDPFGLYLAFPRTHFQRDSQASGASLP